LSARVIGPLSSGVQDLKKETFECSTPSQPSDDWPVEEKPPRLQLLKNGRLRPTVVLNKQRSGSAVVIF
jgi:hypothetical protein